MNDRIKEPVERLTKVTEAARNVAAALARTDWSGVSIGTKALVAKAVQLLESKPVAEVIGYTTPQVLDDLRAKSGGQNGGVTANIAHTRSHQWQVPIYVGPVVAEAQVERCGICFEDEPHTGACGSRDPGALCNKQAVESRQAQDEPENPHRGTSLGEAWHRGFNGERAIAAPGSNYDKAWKEGVAARKAFDTGKQSAADAQVSDINATLEELARTFERQGMKEAARMARGSKPGYPPQAEQAAHSRQAQGGALSCVQERWVKDAIRDAYDTGYSDARNARAVPGDNAPDYRGREIEKKAGERLIAILARAASEPRAEGLTAAARDVLAERQRQMEREGFTPTHDDCWESGELARAAACYAMTDAGQHVANRYWPWAPAWWKPENRRRNLEKAGALILAEIERLDRAAQKKGA